MATSTTTIRTTTTMSGVCAAESDRLYSFGSLYDAYASCRRRKRNTINALRFEAALLDNLVDLGDTLSDGDYKPSRSVCFVAKQPKHREIFAADFRDRVVHHLLVPRIEKIFEPKFIHDSYACRKDKGTHAAVARLQSFMNRITKGGRIAAWFIQLDIRSFFMSIDREILLRILGRNIRDPRVMALAETIVLKDCTKNFIYKGNPTLLKGIPPHKSLFHIPAGKGLPIGNLTSQFFGNVYLNELDQFVKHELKEEYYLRYVDDFIILHKDRDELLEIREKIADFLKQRLELSLKPETVLRRVSEGANFLGYIVRPDYVLVRNRVVGNLRASLRRFEEEMVQYKKAPSPLSSPSRGEDGSRSAPPLRGGDKGEGGAVRIHLREENVRQLRQALASYLGHFKHANAYRLTMGLFEKYSWLSEIFAVTKKLSLNNLYRSPSFRQSVSRNPVPLFILDSRFHGTDNGFGYTLHPLYEPPFEPATLRGQYKWVTGSYGNYCIFFQVGSFCEFYGAQAERYGRPFRLKLEEGKRMPGIQCGFPVRYLKVFKKRARHAGLPYVVIGERGYYPSGLKRRVVSEIFKKGGVHDEKRLY